MDSLEGRRLLSTFTVTSAMDHGGGSLRWAIEQSNSHPGQDTIAFNLLPSPPILTRGTVPTIDLTSALPAVADAVLLDGTTQPGGRLVELNGAGAGTNANGLIITAGDSTVRGLVINRFGGAGIVLDNRGNAGDRLEGNYIGTDKTGAIAQGNHGDAGVVIRGSNNTVGGLTAASRNVISGNNDGILIAAKGDQNTIVGNYIGTAADGVTPLTNDGYGIRIRSAKNQIGGTAAGGRNVISYNGLGGIAIGGNDASPKPANSASQNIVQGNYIGVNKNGTDPLHAPNVFREGTGVLLDGASFNTIGGNLPGAGNVISSNAFAVTMDGRSSSNVVQGNLIGINADGTTAAGTGFGVLIRGSGASGNLIGGTIAGAGNTIAYTREVSVALAAGTGNGIFGNSIFANSPIEYGILLGTDHLKVSTAPHSGPNNYQNPPILTSITRTSSSVTIKGTFVGTPNTPYTFEFFASPNKGEGKMFLGRMIFVPKPGPLPVLAVTFPTTVAASQYITATATDPHNNTSAFSQSSRVS